jgi:predicted Zn-dependent peptidase
LNEDFDKCADILTDVVTNSTFKNADKEINKLIGEINVDLDSPRTKAYDNLIKTLYPNNPYGNSHTRILEALPEINEELLREFHYSNLTSDRMNITVVGDINKDQIKQAFEAKFGNIEKTNAEASQLEPTVIKESKIVTIAKNDAAQAQIFQGWIAPEVTHEDSAAITVLNTILGSSGLSSRLFLELRDKKGLAYHVRSTYEPLKYSGNFTIFIATAPVNINTSIEGFKTEIGKLQDILVETKELEDAKNNILGKRAFFHETNANQANYLGYYDIIGLGADYDIKIQEKIKKVTANDIREVANKYLSQNSILSILAPEEHLKGL